MIDTVKIVNILKEHLPTLQLVYLFGSQADGTSNEESDVDLAFYYTAKISNQARWEVQELVARKIAMDINLIDLHESNEVLDYEIATKGKCIFDNNGDNEITFYLKSLGIYFDYQFSMRPLIEDILDRGSVYK